MAALISKSKYYWRLYILLQFLFDKMQLNCLRLIWFKKYINCCAQLAKSEEVLSIQAQIQYFSMWANVSQPLLHILKNHPISLFYKYLSCCLFCLIFFRERVHWKQWCCHRYGYISNFLMDIILKNELWILSPSHPYFWPCHHLPPLHLFSTTKRLIASIIPNFPKCHHKRILFIKRHLWRSSVSYF